MSKLFILGNGFDLAHGLPTTYNDFRNWLCCNLSDIPKVTIHTPEYRTNYKGMEEYDLAEMSNFFINMIDEIEGPKWQDFEAAIADLNWNSYLSRACDYLFDYRGDYRYIQSGHEDEAQQLIELAHILPDVLFPEWVRETDSSPYKYRSKEFLQLADQDNDYVLNFNYTDTVERLYHLKNICHIHGHSAKFESIIVGHGSTSAFEYENDDNDEFSYLKYDCARKIHDKYKKDTEAAYARKKYFFTSLHDITDIYFHGFSFSEVDLFYLHKLRKHLNDSEVAIHLHSHKKVDWSPHKEIIESLRYNANTIEEFRFADLDDTEQAPAPNRLF